MTIRVGQLSDTHFLEAESEPEGGFAYDTAAAFDAVAEQVADVDLDLVVVTGDIADHGRPAQYRVALDKLQQLAPPVAVTPGNHDQDHMFTMGLSTTAVVRPRVIHHENWCFAFVDSNAGLMSADGDGRPVDPEYDDRLHGDGALGDAEAAWLRDVCATTEANHVFVWLHHPPGTGPGAVGGDPAYDAEWQRLLADLPIIRGLGAGHTHVPTSVEFAGRPVHICPSLKNNFDLDAKTMLPPGWRSYEFEPDGSISTETHLADDDRWPRHPLGRSVVALLRGEISFAQFDEIVARKRAGG